MVQQAIDRKGFSGLISFLSDVRSRDHEFLNGGEMAKYGAASKKAVKSALHREKKGTLRSGKGGKGGAVKSRKQAIAIGLSEARKKGAKVPRKSASRS
jgi:hypothetical protein